MSARPSRYPTERLGADFGRQRLWGTVGLSLMSTVSGYLIELTSSDDNTNYSIGFYICGVFMGLDVILSTFFFKVAGTGDLLPK